MRALSLLALGGLVATPALANPLTFTPLIEQVPLAKDADAVTVRVRSGFEAKLSDFSFLAESEATLAINPAYKTSPGTLTGFAYHYGDEVDAQISVRKGRYTALLKYADYRADRFATDTRKLWLSLDWALS
jgi:hypothetical protein